MLKIISLLYFFPLSKIYQDNVRINGSNAMNPFSKYSVFSYKNKIKYTINKNIEKTHNIIRYFWFCLKIIISDPKNKNKT